MMDDGGRYIMYLTTDDPGSDYHYVTAIAENEEEHLQLNDYVMIQYKRQMWIGQITAPNINISTVGRQFDPAILHAIKLYQQNNNVQLAEHIEMWQIRLLGEYSSGSLSALRRRPGPGAGVERLDRTTTIKVLNLPKLVEKDGRSNVIGYLLNADDVPLCVDGRVFTHHILVSGGTGSGKSNSSANLIRQAARLGFTVFMYDAKPDYQLMANTNNDSSVKEIWPAFEKYGLKPEGAQGLKRVAIYGVGKAGRTEDYAEYGEVIGFRASDFDPYFFASLFFDARAKVNQYEEFASVCAYLKGSRPQFNLDDTLIEVNRRRQNYLDQNSSDPKKQQAAANEPAIHSMTADSIARDVRRNRTRMVWLDTVGKQIDAQPDDTANAFAKSKRSVGAFNPKSLIIQGGGIVHIDCSGLQDQDYALFLSRFMYESQRHQIENKGKSAVVQFIDEAHRVFDNDSRYSDLLGREFNRVMREGRSLKHGIILSLQNASQVPSIVMNNFNSHIVMKQNNRDVARSATQTMGKDFAEQSITLGTGQALCLMFESSSTVLAQMAPSPYELQRSDNADEK
jgi:DNA helicase HerA-like ATPase